MIVVAMRALEESVEVQKQACRAFRHLALVEEYKGFIAVSGGIAALLAAMEVHQSNAGMQVLALGVLLSLSSVPRNRGNFLANDAVRIIKLAMSNHADKTIQKNGAELLIAIGDGGDDGDDEAE